MLLIVGFLSIAIVVSGTFWFATWLASRAYLPQRSGEVGDIFGLANAIFSGLAFAILIITLKLQRDELELQRQELRDTRDVLTRQERELSNQTSAALAQTEEARCISVIQLHRELLATLRHGNHLGGERVFRQWHFELAGTYQHQVNGGTPERQAVATAVRRLERDLIDFPRYAASLETVVKLIFRCQFSDKRTFRDLLWSAMCKEERAVLAYAVSQGIAFADDLAYPAFHLLALCEGLEAKDMFKVEHLERIHPKALGPCEL